MSKFVTALALVAALLFPTFASAQSFPQHYRETVLVASPGQMVNLPIPRLNYPVQVSISAEMSGNPNLMLASFSLVLSSSNVIMTVPPAIPDAGSTQSYRIWQDCADVAAFGLSNMYHLTNVVGSINCMPPNSPATDLFVVGVSGPGTSSPNRVFTGVLNSSVSTTFYITMWY